MAMPRAAAGLRVCLACLARAGNALNLVDFGCVVTDVLRYRQIHHQCIAPDAS